MDNQIDEPNGPQNPTRSDVMDISVDHDQVNKHAQTETSQVAPPYPHPQTSQGTQTEEWTPLRLCQKAHKSQQPHPSQDLLTLYGLSPLVASVARTDPVTGEKINKMRRSYEGQVKAFGIAGRNKSVKHPEGAPGGLAELMAWPEEEWQNQKVAGMELEKGLPSAILAKLEKAMKMEPGPVPRSEEWENILGHEKLKPTGPNPEQKVKHPVQNTTKVGKVNGQVNGVPLSVGTPAAGEVARPKRTGRKRRYDEHSFEGYGEGYLDDDGEGMSLGGYSSGEGSKHSNVSKKKRKKDYNANGPPIISERAGSYGVGMIGVGSGIGAYGR